MGYLYLLFRIPAKTPRASAWRGRTGSNSAEIGGRPCVPIVCQLCKTSRNSTLLCKKDRLRKLLIQSMLSQFCEPPTTSAKKPKNGFVISRSPVQPRRVAP